MKKEKFLEIIKNKLIVSCQALAEEPLHGSEIMAKMSVAAKMGGAVAIRANGKDDIIAIRKQTKLPTIGIIKAMYEDSDVYITPTLFEVKQLIETKTEVIALDATFRERPNGANVADLISYIRANSNCIIMGDVSTVAEGKAAIKLGCDFISTTLSGYTEYSRQLPGADFKLIEDLAKLNEFTVIAEGKLMTPEDAVRAYECGAHSVVIGTAITRPDVITERFAKEIDRFNL